jgi:glycerol-3-phosphate acyltransferase PlsX
MLPFAIDAMGGDNAPKVVLDGLEQFYHRRPKSSFLIYGDEAQINAFLNPYPLLRHVSEIVHTEESISSCAKPSQALRSLPRSSMRLALETVAKGKASAAVSAGNTGAYLALSKGILKTLKGIDRPAIVSIIPTETGKCVMLDLGGNLEASSQNLVEYAIMGDIFARSILGLTSPTVGLLNVGKEENKGGDALQQAFATLKRTPLNFYGFIEGHDIPLGTVSVVVTDGFTGNIALKTMEGVVHFVLSSLKQNFSESWQSKIAGKIARPFMKKLRNELDPRFYNGALWLGLNGIAVKSHGGTDALGFAQALEMAYSMVEAKIVTEIDEALSQIDLSSVRNA